MARKAKVYVRTYEDQKEEFISIFGSGQGDDPMTDWHMKEYAAQAKTVVEEDRKRFASWVRTYVRNHDGMLAARAISSLYN